MHVLPLPFGFALALLPRRDADRLRVRPELPDARTSYDPRLARDRILGDIRFADSRQHVA